MTHRAAAAVLFLFGGILALAAAQLVCITGSAPLVPSSNAPQRPWCNRGGPFNCVLDYSFEFNMSAPSAQRWPLNATLGLGTNRTVVAALWPALADLAFQCTPGGDIVASTRNGPQNQRVRLQWTYAATSAPSTSSSSSCAQLFDSLDVTSQMLTFTASLAYSGVITTYDAVFTSTDTAYSLGAAAYQGSCAQRLAELQAEQDDGTLPNNCTDPALLACRFPSAQWAKKPLTTDVAWQAFIHSSLCALSYGDIISNRGSLVHAQGSNWLAEAREVVAALLNAARIGCAAPYVACPTLLDAYTYVNTSTLCGTNALNATRLAALRAWNNQAQYCVAGPVGVLSGGGNSTDDSGLSTQDTYLIVMIVFIVFSACLLAVVAYLCCFQRWSYFQQAANNLAKQAAVDLPPLPQTYAGMGGEMGGVHYTTLPPPPQAVQPRALPITSPPPRTMAMATPIASAPPRQHQHQQQQQQQQRHLSASLRSLPAHQPGVIEQNGVLLPNTYYTTTSGQ